MSPRTRAALEPSPFDGQLRGFPLLPWPAAASRLHRSGGSTDFDAELEISG